MFCKYLKISVLPANSTQVTEAFVTQATLITSSLAYTSREMVSRPCYCPAIRKKTYLFMPVESRERSCLANPLYSMKILSMIWKTYGQEQRHGYMIQLCRKRNSSHESLSDRGLRTIGSKFENYAISQFLWTMWTDSSGILD